jgi:hypothetical protein
MTSTRTGRYDALVHLIGIGDSGSRLELNGGFGLARFLSIPASARIGSVVFSGSLLGRRPAVTGGVFETPPVSLRTFASPALAHDQDLLAGLIYLVPSLLIAYVLERRISPRINSGSVSDAGLSRRMTAR